MLTLTNCTNCTFGLLKSHSFVTLKALYEVPDSLFSFINILYCYLVTVLFQFQKTATEINIVASKYNKTL